ncbi:MAG: methyltransferase type 12, partial [Betaproteobacteria bacterium]|nr:methyltransferase type 12 [Betaproteobacteria bacterium]
VWCVEYNPEMAEEARRLLARNHNGHKVEVVEADAFSYLPPEPVDVVICEMIHVAMLREKQVEMIESFKRRYLKYFGGPLPVFIPEAAILGVQPLQQEYSFSGFNAPIVQFRDTQFISPGATELAAPAVYRTLDFLQPNDALIKWDGRFKIEQDGAVNALRFITKNILAIDLVSRTTIDWLNHYMVLPLTLPVAVKQGDELRLRFQYRAGGTIPSLIASLRADVARAEAKPTGITKPGRAAKKQPVYS